MVLLRAGVQFQKVAWQYTPNQEITLMLKAFLYTCCADLYISVTYIALSVPQTVYINHEVLWHTLKLVYDFKKESGIAPHQGDQYDASRIFLNTL